MTENNIRCDWEEESNNVYVVRKFKTIFIVTIEKRLNNLEHYWNYWNIEIKQYDSSRYKIYS